VDEILKAHYLDARSELADRRSSGLLRGTAEGKRQMRWGRGFFRLWLVLSVIWVVAAGYVLRDNLWLLTQWDVLSDQDASSASTNTDDNDISALLSRRANEVRQILREDAFGTLATVLLPPLVSLPAGVTLAWIGRGFLRRREHS
jgi:hypothetical protein